MVHILSPSLEYDCGVDIIYVSLYRVKIRDGSAMDVPII